MVTHTPDFEIHFHLHLWPWPLKSEEPICHQIRSISYFFGRKPHEREEQIKSNPQTVFHLWTGQKIASKPAGFVNWSQILSNIAPCSENKICNYCQVSQMKRESCCSTKLSLSWQPPPPRVRSDFTLFAHFCPVDLESICNRPKK